MWAVLNSDAAPKQDLSRESIHQEYVQQDCSEPQLESLDADVGIFFLPDQDGYHYDNDYHYDPDIVYIFLYWDCKNGKNLTFRKMMKCVKFNK